MKLMLLTEDDRLAESLQQAVGSSHNVTVVSSEKVLENGSLPENIEGILIDERSWQRNASIFRYFDILPLFQKYPFGIIVKQHNTALKAIGKRKQMGAPAAVLMRNFGHAEATEAVRALDSARVLSESIA